MQKTTRPLILSRSREAGFMLQLQLRKTNLKEEEPGLPPKNKNNTDNVISSQPSLAL
jgi:hypothetical protein